MHILNSDLRNFKDFQSSNLKYSWIGSNEKNLLVFAELVISICNTWNSKRYEYFVPFCVQIFLLILLDSKMAVYVKKTYILSCKKIKNKVISLHFKSTTFIKKNCLTYYW